MSELASMLLEDLAAGTLRRFGELSPGQIEGLEREFSRGPFSDEQRSVLAGLVLDATGREGEIAAFNAASGIHKLVPARLNDGTPVLPVSLLTWAGAGQGFCGAWELLLSMPVCRVTTADWPATVEES